MKRKLYGLFIGACCGLIVGCALGIIAAGAASDSGASDNAPAWLVLLGNNIAWVWLFSIIFGAIIGFLSGKKDEKR